MSVLAAAALLTVEEAREIAAQNPLNSYELHGGELIQVTVPKLDHTLLQRHIARILEPLTFQYGLLCLEFGFRSQPEFEVRRADVALITRERLTNAPADFFGAPDLVIEILSPSNRAAEMDEKESLCLSNGCLSFWVVNPARRNVRVTSREGRVSRFHLGDRIPLAPFGSASVAVEELIPASRALD